MPAIVYSLCHKGMFLEVIEDRKITLSVGISTMVQRAAAAVSEKMTMAIRKRRLRGCRLARRTVGS
jgi:hypothetical protein